MVTGASGMMPHARLTDLGREQASAAAARLAAEPIVRVYASTAIRARDTAGPIAAARGVDVVTLPELSEVGIGTAEGSLDPVVRSRTAEVLRAWVVDRRLSARLADGESGHEVVARMTSALRAIAAAHPGGTVAVVGHVGSLTLALSELCGIGARIWGSPLPHAVPFPVERRGHGWRCGDWPRPTVAPAG